MLSCGFRELFLEQLFQKIPPRFPQYFVGIQYNLTIMLFYWNHFIAVLLQSFVLLFSSSFYLISLEKNSCKVRILWSTTYWLENSFCNLANISYYYKPINDQCSHNVQTSHLIRIVTQMSGFHIMLYWSFNGLNVSEGTTKWCSKP